MGKVCIVAGCKSGSQADIKQRQADEVRKCTLFRAPQDLSLRKLWADELGIELKDKDRICELHFEYEDLNMSDDYTLINGEIIVSVRERITLKKNAVPVRDLAYAAYQKRQANGVQKNAHSSSTTKKYVPSTQTAKRKAELVDDSTDEVDDNYISQDVEMEEIETFDPYVKTDEDIGSDVDNSVDKEITGTDCHRNELSITDSVFGLAKLKEILEKSPLRRNWAWGEKDGDIFFTLFDFNALAARCYLQVHPNMKITTLLSDKEKLVNFTGVHEIKSFEDLTEILQRLENQKLCLGTGLPQKSRSDTCAINMKTADIFICLFCLKEKMKLEKSKLLTDEKYNDSFKNNILLKKKASYYSKKLDEARNRIKELEEEFDNLEKIVIDKILGKLPNIQREIVSMFMKFADVSRNRLRYSRDWVQESLLMRRKSCALYEYMRKRGLLPLPSAQTLQELLDSTNATEHETANADGLDTYETSEQGTLDSSALYLNNSEQI